MEPGTRLGAYEIASLVGTGGMDDTAPEATRGIPVALT